MSISRFCINNSTFSLIAAPKLDRTSSVVRVISGFSLTLSCISRGSPPDSFTWWNNGFQINQSTNITAITHTNNTAIFRSDYYIDAVTTDNGGVYICNVTNPIGSDSKAVTVNVAGMFGTWLHITLYYCVMYKINIVLETVCLLEGTYVATYVIFSFLTFHNIRNKCHFLNLSYVKVILCIPCGCKEVFNCANYH